MPGRRIRADVENGRNMSGDIADDRFETEMPAAEQGERDQESEGQRNGRDGRHRPFPVQRPKQRDTERAYGEA